MFYALFMCHNRDLVKLNIPRTRENVKRLNQNILNICSWLEKYKTRCPSEGLIY